MDINELMQWKIVSYMGVVLVIGLVTALYFVKTDANTVMSECYNSNYDLRTQNNQYVDMVNSYQGNITVANKWIRFIDECGKLNSSVQFVGYGYICVKNNETLANATNGSNI